jgi:hypothetical protein
MFAQVIVFLLLCGIVGGEIPELLALTDNTTNDFTILKMNSVISPRLRNTSGRIRVADVVELKITAHGMLFQHFHRSKEQRFPQAPSSLALSSAHSNHS